MSETEYKEYICELCNRIIKEKLVHIIKDDENSRETNNGKTKIVFKIQLTPVEWYMELDDDIKFNVEYNLQEIFKPLIIEAIDSFSRENNENNNFEIHNNKRQKI